MPIETPKKAILAFITFFSISSVSYSQGLEFIVQAYSDEVLVKKNEDRFIITINNAPVNDEYKLMDEYSLQIQWWTLLAEPIEYYTIKWESTGKYKIGDEVLNRNQLLKYPDLLKRFDNLQPTKLDIKIEGLARRGYKLHKNGLWKREFSYVIEDIKLLTSKAGKKGQSIVPGSPHWNEFIDWGDKRFYEKKDKNNKNLITENKQNFKKAETINVTSKVLNLEWNETELRSILEIYKRYESGELEPSPIQEVKEKTERETKDLKKYTKNDFWGEIEKPKELTYIAFKGANGKYGIKNYKTNKITVQPKYYFIHEYAKGKNDTKAFFSATNKRLHKYADGNMMNKNRYEIIDQFGNTAYSGKFHIVTNGNADAGIMLWTWEIKETLSPCNRKGSLSTLYYQRFRQERVAYDKNFNKIKTIEKKYQLPCARR